MTTLGEQVLARGRTDAEGRLVEADGVLARLHFSCGGEIGSTIAAPELLALVDKALTFGLKLARPFTAVDGQSRITAWVELSPERDADNAIIGCAIAVASWQEEELAAERDAESLRRHHAIHRQLAEATLRLDHRQAILSIATEAADLAEFRARSELAVGTPWTDLVTMEGASHRLPLHWRLLDGSVCTIEGSTRRWTAHLDALGQPEPGSAGFVLTLSADTPLALSNPGAAERDAEGPSFGRDLTPVLRQPVNRIIANAETIRTRLAGPLSEEYSAYAADIATAGQHLLELIDDLTDLEVVESDDFTTAPDRIELADVARRACGILGVRAREKRIVLVPPPEGESQLAIAEFRRVLQILLNLVGNAIRYSPEDSQIWLRLDRIGSRALVTVADQGHGLDAAQQERVFVKFERLGRSGDGGSGLGLYI